MQRWALVTDGTVVNSIIGTADFVTDLAPEYDAVVETTDMTPWPSVGWTYDGAAFSPPPPPQPEPEA